MDKDPRLAYAYVALGAGYRRLGDEARAVIEYRRALDLLRAQVEARPIDRDAWQRLAATSQSLGDYRAVDQAREVLGKLERDALYEGDSRHVIAGSARRPVAAEAE